MYLYECKQNTKIKLLEDAPGPPHHRTFHKGEEILFKHIDGAYSLCYDTGMKMVHLPACTEVEYLDKKVLDK